MSKELLVESLVAKVRQLERSEVAPAAPEGALDLLAKLRDAITGLTDGIDAEEAEALLAQAADVFALLAAGAWVKGALAMVALMRAYRNAKAN